jgi:uncharacterized protein HemX
MKTAFVRTLVLISLALSLGSFAAAKEHKSNSSTTISATSQQAPCSSAQENKKQNKINKPQDHSGQEQEFDRMLMGIYG